MTALVILSCEFLINFVKQFLIQFNKIIELWSIFIFILKIHHDSLFYWNEQTDETGNHWKYNKYILIQNYKTWLKDADHIYMYDEKL